MSERPPDLPAAEAPEPRESALVVLFRRGPREFELLLGRRSRRSRFLPGYWAFLGGGMEAGDEPERPGAHARCALRELREETGIVLSEDALVSIGIRTTPSFHPVRFRTGFYLAEAPEGLVLPEPAPRPDEIEALEFFEASSLLEDWRAGRRPVPPPIPPLLRALGEVAVDRPLAELAARLSDANAREEDIPRIEFLPGYWLVPQRSRTLPPATHTNAWLAGGRHFVVVDPGSDDSDELALLEATIRRRAADEGDALRAILLTHHHQDHVAGAPALAESLGVPILTHAETVPRLPFADHPALEAGLEDGQHLDLGGSTLRVVHTPGHAPGHVALFDEARGVLVAADLVSGLSTIVVLPGEGDMGAYLRSLECARDLSPQLVLPAHGPPLPASALRATLDHRLSREAKVLAALDARPRRLREIAGEAYADEPRVPQPLAEIQARAHLEWLVRRGLAERDRAGWRRP